MFSTGTVFPPTRHFQSVLVEPKFAEVQLCITGLLSKPSLSKSRHLEDSDKKLEMTCYSFYQLLSYCIGLTFWASALFYLLLLLVLGIEPNATMFPLLIDTNNLEWHVISTLFSFDFGTSFSIYTWTWVYWACAENHVMGQAKPHYSVISEIPDMGWLDPGRMPLYIG